MQSQMKVFIICFLIATPAIHSFKIPEILTKYERDEFKRFYRNIQYLFRAHDEATKFLTDEQDSIQYPEYG